MYKSSSSTMNFFVSFLRHKTARLLSIHTGCVSAKKESAKYRERL